MIANSLIELLNLIAFKKVVKYLSLIIEIKVVKGAKQK